MWPFSGEKKRVVLIVDDDVNFRTMLAMYFEDMGWEVRQAGNGRQGVDMAVASPPDLVLLDIQLPVMSGMIVLTILRANQKAARIPIIMVTAGSGLDDVESCLAQGANDYINKPFDFARLKAKVDKLLPQV